MANFDIGRAGLQAVVAAVGLILLVFGLAACGGGQGSEPSTPVEPPPGAVRDQGRIHGTGGIVELGASGWSQSITTGIEGRLAAVAFQIETPLSSLPVEFDLALYEGGNPPAGSALLTERVTATGGGYLWDVSNADVSFAAGDVFTFTLSASHSDVVLSANDPPGYGGGELFKDGDPSLPDGPSDLAFITYVFPSG